LELLRIEEKIMIKDGDRLATPVVSDKVESNFLPVLTT
jgi:hypothetical protein